MPANLYGRALESIALQADAKEFGRFIRSDAIRGVFDLQISGEKEVRRVILRGVVRKGGTGDPIHADFFQVDPERPVTVNIPLNFIGEAPAVRELAGELTIASTTARVRCLPRDIPSGLDVNLEGLDEFGKGVTFGDLARAANATILNVDHLMIASVDAPRIIEIEEPEVEGLEEVEELEEGEEAPEGGGEGDGEGAGEEAQKSSE